MEQVNTYNPFGKRESHSSRSLLGYKVLTIASWFLVHIVDIHFGFNAPAGDSSNRSIWGQNSAHPTPFSLNQYIVDIYWIIILVLQIGYLFALFSSNSDNVAAAANIGSHFIVNNLLQFAFVMLWVHSHFVWAELVLLVNFFNLSFLYFRHSRSPRLIHIAVVSGPLAWTFVAIFWCGAAMVNAQNLAARILANIAVWGILGYGLFFLAAFKDYTMGFELSVLAASLGVHQFFIKAIAFQWIFAFVIMGVLFMATLAIAIPGFFGKELSFRREGDIVDADRERQPLLNDA
ncbi:hypothetical protein MMC19_003729 [Ptychographa xylographoides]|nr:hypothetical protein [Ptychographa xylographoides]